MITQIIVVASLLVFGAICLAFAFSIRNEPTWDDIWWRIANFDRFIESGLSVHDWDRQERKNRRES